jgi:hypothetical protein
MIHLSIEQFAVRN